MCMQCVTGASVVAGASATGFLAWLRVHRPFRINPRRMKAISAGLLVLAVIASGAVASPSGSSQAARTPSAVAVESGP